MNANQVKGILRAIVPAAVAYVVGRGWLSQGSASDVAAALIALLSAGWSVQAHTDASAIKAVAAMPDIQAIVAEPNPRDGVAAAVADPTQTKVVSSTQGPKP